MDVSSDRSVEINKGGLLTVRMNEAATPYGYAWIVPEPELKCVTMLNDNYGDFITGYKQWVFQGNEVTEHCTDTITVQRSANFETCPGCSDEFTISVAPITVEDASAVVEDVYNDDDTAEVK